MYLVWLWVGIGLAANDLPPLLAQAELSDYSYWARACETQLAARNYAEAVQACDRAIALDPTDPRAWLGRAAASLALEDYSGALLAYERVARLDGTSSEAFAGQCESHYLLEQYRAAIAACSTALQLDRSWGRFSPPRAWYYRGQAESALSQIEDALVSFSWAIQLQRDYAPALAGKCLVLLQQGQPEAALGACEAALQGDWDNLNPSLARGYQALALAESGRHSEALESYNKALALAPNDAALWTAQGRILGQLGRYREAVASHRWAVTLSPNSSPALTNLCASLNRLNQEGASEQAAGGYQEALETCEKALREGDGRWQEDGPAFAWAETGNALVGLGRYAEALSSFERSLALVSTRAETWSDRAVALWNLERYSEALDSAETALKNDPGLSRAWYNKGRIFVTLGRNAEAISAYQNALQGDGRAIDPNERVAILINLSALQWRSQSYPEALQRAQEALALRPDSVDALFNQALALVALERYDRAQETLERLLEIAPEYPNAMRVTAVVRELAPATQPFAE